MKLIIMLLAFLSLVSCGPSVDSMSSGIPSDSALSTCDISRYLYCFSTHETPVNEVQQIVIRQKPNTGTFSFTFDGQTTATLDFDDYPDTDNADPDLSQAALNTLADAIETALNNLSNLSAISVTANRTDEGGGIYTLDLSFTFTGADGDIDQPSISINSTSLTKDADPVIAYPATPQTGGGCAFITSTTYPGNMSGITGANAICQQEAEDYSIGCGDNTTWVAWLTDSNSIARNSIDTSYIHSPIDSTPFFMNDVLVNVIDTALDSSTISDRVWVGDSSNNCNNWNSSASDLLGLAPTQANSFN